MLAKLTEDMFDPHIVFVDVWFRSSQHLFCNIINGYFSALKKLLK